MKSKDLIAKQERTEFLFDSYRERARKQAAKLLCEAIENYGQLFTDDDEDASPSATLYMNTSSDVDGILMGIVTTGHYHDMVVEALEDDDSEEYSVDLDDPDEVIEHLLELISPEKAIQIIAQTLAVED